MRQITEPKKETNYRVGVHKIADMLDMTDRNVRELVNKKILPRTTRGEYDMFYVSKAYVKHLKDRLAGRIVDPEENDLRGRKLRAETEEREAKARLRQIELEEEIGQLFRREDIVRQWSGRLLEFKAAMLELPKRVAFRFVDSDISANVEEEVSMYVNEILTRYSREGIVPDCPLGVGDDATDPDPAEGDNSKPVGGRKSRTKRKSKPTTGTVEDKPDAVSS